LACGVFGGEETSVDAKTLSHMCGNSDVHPSLIVDCAALGMSLRPGCKQKECLDEMN
jgi:hypothetical protein